MRREEGCGLHSPMIALSRSSMFTGQLLGGDLTPHLVSGQCKVLSDNVEVLISISVSHPLNYSFCLTRSFLQVMSTWVGFEQHQIELGQGYVIIITDLAAAK